MKGHIRNNFFICLLSILNQCANKPQCLKILLSFDLSYLGGLFWYKKAYWRLLYFFVSGRHCKTSSYACVCQYYCCNAWMVMKLLNYLLPKALVIPLRLKYRDSWLWNTFNHVSISKCNILQILYLQVNLLFAKIKYLLNWTRGKCDFTLHK